MTNDGSPTKFKCVSPKTKTASTSKYKYVYFSNYEQKYKSAILVNKKLYALGSYCLESDAAWSVDICSRELEFPSVNFDNRSVYINARKQEENVRGISVPYLAIEAHIASKVHNVVSKAEVLSKSNENKVANRSVRVVFLISIERTIINPAFPLSL